MDKIIKIYKEIMTGIGIVGLVGFIASVLIQVVSRTFLPTAPTGQRKRPVFSSSTWFHLPGMRRC